MIASTCKALSLALMAVAGLMAFVAAGAQAETVGQFLLDGKVASGGTISASLTDGKVTLDTTLGETPLRLTCTTLKVTESSVGEKDIKVTSEIAGCTVAEPFGLCKMEEPIVVKALALPLLHKSIDGVERTYILVQPWEGTKTFTVLHFLKCGLSEAVSIRGSFTLKDCENTMLTERETHLLEEVNLGLGEGLKFGPREASLLGSSLWSVPPGHQSSAH